VKSKPQLIGLAAAGLFVLAGVARAQDDEQSVARQWNEIMLEAIRADFARPTVHARNLFHTSVAMWDAWAAYDPVAATYIHHEKASAPDVAAARAEAISHASYRVLSARFGTSPGSVATLAALDAKMSELGYDTAVTTTVGTSAAALGNRIGAAVLAFGAKDNANEVGGYTNLSYEPVNPPLLPAFPGNPTLLDTNRWQPLALEFFIDQSGNPFPTGEPEFLSPEWGAVTPFALRDADRTVFRRRGFDYVVYHDPGPPPLLGGEGDAEYRAGFEQVVEWSSKLDPSDGEVLDIGPGARGNNTLGTNDGSGRTLNPRTGEPYAPQIVPAGDYYRVLAEFWADGPDSETPPGHWFVLANYVSDHPDVVKRIRGTGPELGALEWDVKLYLALSGAMHDSAVTAWGVKGWYDYIRPVSAIRYLADNGQSSDPDGPSYHVDGIALIPDVIEVVTAETIAPGARHGGPTGLSDENVGKIAFRAWRGPDFIFDPETSTAGVGWILAENWWPYQRPSFVTPPFAGYVSGHSTYSRAAAELLTAFTGDPYFPGGLGEFEALRDSFLVFENGPSETVTLQWATYFDAADECSISRIYGGIHPRADDIPGRLMGATIGPAAFETASAYFAPPVTVSITHGSARRRRRGKGVLKIRGALPEALDVASGLSVTVGYDTSRFESGTLRAKDCKTRRSGRVIGRARDRSLKVDFKPSKTTPGAFDFVIRLKVAQHGDPACTPLTIHIRDGTTVRTGTIENCRAAGTRRRPKLVWDDEPL